MGVGMQTPPQVLNGIKESREQNECEKSQTVSNQP